MLQIIFALILSSASPVIGFGSQASAPTVNFELVSFEDVSIPESVLDAVFEVAATEWNVSTTELWDGYGTGEVTVDVMEGNKYLVRDTRISGGLLQVELDDVM